MPCLGVGRWAAALGLVSENRNYRQLQLWKDCAKETGWLWFAVSINFPVEHFYRKLKNKADFILISSDGFQIFNTSNQVCLMEESPKNRTKNNPEWES